MKVGPERNSSAESLGGREARRGRGRNLIVRLLTAAVGLPLVAATIYLGGWPFALVAAALAFLAATEFMHGWLMPTMPIPAILQQAPAYSAAAVAVAGAHADERFALLAIGFAGVFAAMGYSRTNALGPRKPFRVLSWCLLYCGLLPATLVLTRDADFGREWVYLGVLSTFAVDTGAYATGSLIGRHKMAPGVSPGKTWEGAAGGYSAGVAACLGLNGLLDTGVAATTILPLALALPLAAEAGDLFESWMKRRMGVKDASGLLPGHGGLLDRLDSVLFVMPLVYVFLRLRVL